MSCYSNQPTTVHSCLIRLTEKFNGLAELHSTTGIWYTLRTEIPLLCVPLISLSTQRKRCTTCLQQKLKLSCLRWWPHVRIHDYKASFLSLNQLLLAFLTIFIVIMLLILLIYRISFFSHNFGINMPYVHLYNRQGKFPMIQIFLAAQSFFIIIIIWPYLSEKINFISEFSHMCHFAVCLMSAHMTARGNFH